MSPEDQAILVDALCSIIRCMHKYLPPNSGIDNEQFISTVIGAVDNPDIDRVLESLAPGYAERSG